MAAGFLSSKLSGIQRIEGFNNVGYEVRDMIPLDIA